MSGLRRVHESGREWLDRRRWTKTLIPLSPTQDFEPSFLFLTPDFDVPAGGIKVMYRHVDILNGAGLSAAVMHQRPNFRCSWFVNDTAIVCASQRTIGPKDLLVLPELDVGLMAGSAFCTPHVVLNQSGWLTWQRDADAVDSHYRSPIGPRAIVTVSEYAARLLRAAFPHQDTRVVRPGVDTGLFMPGDKRATRIISYMPRRGQAEATILWKVLGDTLTELGWRVDAIDGVPQQAVAQRLRRSQVFVSLGMREGFGLPAAEAMAAGNYVVGFHGFGGREFFRPEFSSPVETGDVLALAQEIARVLRCEEAEPGWLERRGRQASEYIRERYSPEAESDDVLRAYPDLRP